MVLRTQTYSKTIKVNDDGTFRDTLKVDAGLYNFYDGGESTNLYLKNGYDLNVTIDTKRFDESITYEGVGAETNNYLAQKALMEETLYPPGLWDFEEADFKSTTAEIHAKLTAFLDKNKNIDSTLLSQEKKGLEAFKDGIFNAYKQNMASAQARASKFADYIGKPAPAFENYENAKGGTTSLSDLKGKYVYVDVWATWCGPCIKEIPALKEIEKEFHDKNIAFLSLSVDDGRGYKNRDAAAARAGWKTMIKEKDLGGIQVLSDKGWQSDFVQGFEIKGIPRFILIDPAGNIVNADAPRPSSPKLREVLNSLENI
ncbi:TlpA disulfide reductase family protein [Lacinutrix neustonica]|uniref:TlpA disulfide reductase family protein n=1 Tax=Lacinutrix neustonica TaxID=2980107 RepID=A0A9E8SHL7_9FLAO|nr:TlpA disulfide reductase family protein [Lacinutrix neustonica]WAC02825.1 TlpA disulfide reductase family protein [Lacinutrix neustonica]